MGKGGFALSVLNVKKSNYHSIVCHFPKCRGTAEMAPGREWICEECSMDFKMKIVLGQHKRLAHLLIRNQERVAFPPKRDFQPRSPQKMLD